MIKTHCKNGHEYTGSNTYKYRGYRMCKSCRNINAVTFRYKHKKKVDTWQQDNYAKNTAKILEYKKKYRAEYRDKNARYNLSVPYHEMLIRQNGVCAICSKAQAGKSLAVDHDHNCCPTGTSCGNCVRELLCMTCNTVLGLVEDSQEHLVKLIKYLQKHEDAGVKTVIEEVV